MNCERKMKTRIKNQQSFRGVWVPPFLLDKLQKREIQAKEFTFLLFVDSKINSLKRPPKGDFHLSKRENRKIARALNVETSWIRNKIPGLIKDGLLIETVVDQKFYYRTLWSRPQVETIGKKSLIKKQTKSKKSDKDKRTEKWRDCAEQLNNEVKEITHIDRSRHILKWANCFRLLHEQDGVDEADIKETLSWYLSVLHNGDKFLPQAYSGNSFREKFERLVQAKKRYEGEKKTGERTDVVVEDDGEIDDDEWEAF